MLYYNEFSNGVRYVKEYDEQKHGEPRFRDSSAVAIYHSSLYVSAVFDTVEEALEAWGRYSLKPVYMPDSSVVIPAEYFNKTPRFWPLQPYNFNAVEVVC